MAQSRSALSAGPDEALSEAAEDDLAPVDFPQQIGREVDALSHIVDDIKVPCPGCGTRSPWTGSPPTFTGPRIGCGGGGAAVGGSPGVELAGGGERAIPVTGDAAELSRALHNHRHRLVSHASGARCPSSRPPTVKRPA